MDAFLKLAKGLSSSNAGRDSEKVCLCHDMCPCPDQSLRRQLQTAGGIHRSDECCFLYRDVLEIEAVSILQNDEQGSREENSSDTRVAPASSHNTGIHRHDSLSSTQASAEPRKSTGAVDAIEAALSSGEPIAPKPTDDQTRV